MDYIKAPPTYLDKNQNSIASQGGLRTKGFLKKSNANEPLISIITVVFNDEKYIEDTILSVINQTYANLEYIVIDGGSSDKTKQIINKYDNKIDCWISEPDEGIYDAMNKGIELVSGEWVNFVNSSDTLDFDAYSIISNCLKINSNKYDAIAFGYSYSALSFKGNMKKVTLMPYLFKKWKMPSSHNAILYISSTLKEFKFNLNYKYASDFDQINKIREKYIVNKNNYILSNQRADGYIVQNKFQSFFEHFQICWKDFKIMYAFYWISRMAIVYLNIKVKKIYEK
jgi:glycosyltransferase involved in cell wall biosynthesis